MSNTTEHIWNECKITNKKFTTKNRFTRHLTSIGVTPKSYYDRFHKKDGEGICSCGNETTFREELRYLKSCSLKCS